MHCFFGFSQKQGYFLYSHDSIARGNAERWLVQFIKASFSVSQHIFARMVSSRKIFVIQSTYAVFFLLFIHSTYAVFLCFFDTLW